MSVEKQILRASIRVGKSINRAIQQAERERLAALDKQRKLARELAAEQQRLRAAEAALLKQQRELQQKRQAEAARVVADGGEVGFGDLVGGQHARRVAAAGGHHLDG